MFFRPINGFSWARDLDGFFADFLPSASTRRSSFPAVNFWQNDESLVLTAEVPGLDAENIDINVKENVLTLSGKVREAAVPENSRIHRQERYNDEFKRSFRLPYRVNLDGVEATFEKGILQVILPRIEQERPRKIPISRG